LYKAIPIQAASASATHSPMRVSATNHLDQVARLKFQFCALERSLRRVICQRSLVDAQGWSTRRATPSDRAGSLDERLRRRLFEVRRSPMRHPRRSTGRACLHVGGNGRGNLEMAVSLDFSHLQQIGWK
jgi:hypothetical protein